MQKFIFADTNYHLKNLFFLHFKRAVLDCAPFWMHACSIDGINSRLFLSNFVPPCYFAALGARQKMRV